MATLCLLLVVLCGGEALAGEGKRLALVIGNKSYADAPLTNPANDAVAMGKALEGLGFEVTESVDLDRQQMRDAIRDFGDSLGKDDVGLFYFSGHGAQVKGENYLIPIGADIRREDEIEGESVNAGQVLAKMDNAHNGLNIVILDACRSNPFGRSFRGGGNKGLAQMDAPAGTVIVYATAPGKVAADGVGDNGLYTSHLLAHLKTPGIDISETLRLTRVDVIDESKRLGAEPEEVQVPWEASSLTGQFCFAGCDASVSPVAAAPTPAVAPVAPTPAPISGTSNTATVYGNYRINGDGTVTDTETGLMWMRCAEGQSGEDCSKGEVAMFTPNDALAKFGSRSSFAGYSDWLIPTVDELKSLVYCSNDTPLEEAFDHGCNGKNDKFQRPTINPVVFPNTSPTAVFGAMTSRGGRDMTLHYYHGDHMPKYPMIPIRLVRSSQ